MINVLITSGVLIIGFGGIMASIRLAGIRKAANARPGWEKTQPARCCLGITRIACFASLAGMLPLGIRGSVLCLVPLGTFVVVVIFMIICGQEALGEGGGD
jgi:hypothetical protein